MFINKIFNSEHVYARKASEYREDYNAEREKKKKGEINDYNKNSIYHSPGEGDDRK